ncbi:uncharacterized protein LOC108665766 [Hyalella azteca]|uniref:Glycosyltransferase family 92 protein n=1 Tax=Hyalella azteca TaxID=294128 RepID=A0A8B7N2J0_HYAAZ|nr:uncharacterized protein LOC108665766 [Hyalella azteca]
MMPESKSSSKRFIFDGNPAHPAFRQQGLPRDSQSGFEQPAAPDPEYGPQNFVGYQTSRKKEDWRPNLIHKTAQISGVTSTKPHLYTDYDRLRNENILKQLVPFHKSLDEVDSVIKETSNSSPNTKPILISQVNSEVVKRATSTELHSLSSSVLTAHSDAKWTRITDDLYVYSSFWDDRAAFHAPFSRTLGILKYNESFAVKQGFQPTGELKPEAANVICYLWHSSYNQPVVGRVTISFYEERFDSFVGIFLKCHPPFPANFTHSSDQASTMRSISNFYAVSFIPKVSIDYPHKMIYFENSSPDANRPRNTRSSAVCVRPLYGPYNGTDSLLQFVIYYSAVLHVNQFYFYDLAMSHSIKELMRKLQDAGMALEVISWNLPTGSWSELWDYGSLSAMNDCVYRAMRKFDHVIIVDIDEFLVSKTKSNVANIYESVLRQKTGKHGDAVLVPNVFFCSEFAGNLEPTGKKITGAPSYRFKLPIFKKVIRESRAWPATIRSKLLLTPGTVESVGHHMVNHFVAPSYINLGASTSQVVMNHYRDCKGLHHGLNNTGLTVLGQPTARDITMLKYVDIFMKSKLMKKFKEYLL